jgi:hypothetical protein
VSNLTTLKFDQIKLGSQIQMLTNKSFEEMRDFKEINFEEM